MSGRLDGKIAVITGAGSGMGAAMAKAFCSEGAKVVAADISGQEEVIAKELGKACLPFHTDVTKSKDVQAMLQFAVSKFGRLDILCNNAGIAGAAAPTGEYREEDFEKVWDVNGRPVFFGMRYAIPIMLSNGGGSIINTASLASLVAFPSMIAYGAAKGAVLMMTKTAAVEYAGRGIRVNAICPGVIRTGLTKGMSEEYVAEVKKTTPMGRIAEPSEVANLVVFLASDESSFVTGTSVTIDGGYTAL